MNIKEYSNKPVKVFGPKNFGKVEINQLLSVDYKSRINIQGSIDSEVLNINNKMKELIDKEIFVDTLELFCGSNATYCPLFVHQDQLITYDGRHLTKYGARFLGREMLKQQRFKDLLKFESLP